MRGMVQTDEGDLELGDIIVGVGANASAITTTSTRS